MKARRPKHEFRWAVAVRTRFGMRRIEAVRVTAETQIVGKVDDGLDTEVFSAGVDGDLDAPGDRLGLLVALLPFPVPSP